MGIIELFWKLLGKEETAGSGTGNGDKKNSAGDLTLSCAECRKDFTFEKGEQDFFKQRGLTQPKRCPSCRGRSKRRRR